MFCAYCGAPLNPLFYFCLRCATPYKHVEAVTPPHRPRKLTGEELVAIKAPRVAPLIWTYVAVLVVVTIFGFLVVPDDEPQFLVYFSNVAMLITTSIFAGLYWQSLKVQLARVGFGCREAWAAVLVGLPILLGLNFFWHELLLHWLAGSGVEAFELEMIEDLRRNMGPVTAVLAFCLIPAVTEEIAFRGLLQHWLGVAIKPIHALLIASALFAGIHFTIYSFPILFGLGLLMGWAKMKSRSLYPAMLIHFLHNLVVIELF